MHIQTHTIVELVRNHSINKSQLVSVNTEYEVKLDVSDNRYVGLHWKRMKIHSSESCLDWNLD